MNALADTQKCLIPEQFQGDFFSLIEGMDGQDFFTLISNAELKEYKTHKGQLIFDASCIERWDDNYSYDADGNHNSKILFYSRYYTSICICL